MARRKSVRAFARKERIPAPGGDPASVRSVAPFGGVPLTPPVGRAPGATSLGDTGIGALVETGFGPVPPVEDTRPGQAVPLPVAEPPASPLRPREGAERRKLFPTRDAADFLHDAAREAFVRFGDLDAARRHAVESVKSVFERVEIKGGWILRPKAKSAIDIAVGQRASQVGRREESPDVAAARKDWEAAARSGDPDAMTRTANALIRAVEADRAARGEASQTGTKTLSGRHPIDEILAPRKRPDGYRVIVPQGALDAGGRPVGVPPRSNAEAPTDHIATEAGAQRVVPATSDADQARGWVWDTPVEGQFQALSPEQMKWAANRIMQLPEGEREEVLRQFGERFGSMSGRVGESGPQKLTAASATHLATTSGIDRQLPNQQYRARKTAQSPELPKASVNEIGDDPPISFSEPSQPPEVRPELNGQICNRGWCREARDRNETDEKMSSELRLFELRIIKKLYGPNATRAWMKRNKMDYHAYRNTTRFRAPPGTTLAQVREKLRLWAAPQASYEKPQRDRPVESGDESELYVNYDDIAWFLEWLDIKIPIRGGMVTHYVDEDSGALANVTQPDHVLHPGYILRWVEQLPDGSFVIHTLGRGLGANSRVNETAGSNMFTELDDAVVRDLGGSVVD